MTYWFVFDRRGDFQSYVASFSNEEEARRYADEKLGDYGHVTSDLRSALVVPTCMRGGWKPRPPVPAAKKPAVTFRPKKWK